MASSKRYGIPVEPRLIEYDIPEELMGLFEHLVRFDAFHNHQFKFMPAPGDIPTLQQLDLTKSEITDDVIQNMKLLEARLIQYGFDPILTELSHFGLDFDTTEKGFIAVLWSDQELQERYAASMGDNARADEDFTGGPIVPSEGLYKRPYWISSVGALMETSCEITPPYPNPEACAAIYQYSPGLKFSQKVTPDTDVVGSYVLDYHRRIIEMFRPLVPSACMSDLVIIPFTKVEVKEPEVTEREPQGGALIAVGRFREGATPEDGARDKVFARHMLLLSREFEHSAAVELGRQAWLAKARESVLTQTLVTSGSIHELRAAATEMQGDARDVERAIHRGDIEKALLINRHLENQAISLKAIGDALIQPVDEDTLNALRLVEAIRLSQAYLFHARSGDHLSSEPGSARQSVWRQRGQDEDAILRWLRQQGGEGFSALSEVTSDRGPNVIKLIVALKNLLDNSIKGCGDVYDASGKCVNADQPRSFTMKINPALDDVVAKDPNDEVLIANSAMLPEYTYENSFFWISPHEPSGIVFPTRSNSGQVLQAKKSAMALEGSRLAQVLLHTIGFQVRISPWLSEGRHIGTLTIVTRSA